MIYSISDELLFVIFCFVESDYSRYVEMFEYLKVVFRCVAPPFKFTDVVKWSHERNELIRYNPVQVTIFNFFIIFIFFVIELSKLLPT